MNNVSEKGDRNNEQINVTAVSKFTFYFLNLFHIGL
jgi:hypothetical protein